MTQGRVISLSVHRNTSARRRAKQIKQAATSEIRRCVDDLGDAEAFFIVALNRSGQYRVSHSFPDGSNRAIWAAMLAEAADQALE